MKRQAVRLLSGTRFEGAARMRYAAVAEHVPSVFLSPNAQKAQGYDQLTVAIAARALAAGGSSVDAGAHCGGILRHLVKLSPTAQHWAFEPIPNLAAHLCKRFPGVHVEQVALSDYSGGADFHFIPAVSAHSSLLARPQVEVGQAVHRLRVEVRRLDDVIPYDEPIDFMKIDVEGSEAAVLRGALNLLRSHRPVIVFECDPTDLTQCMAVLDQANLRVSLLTDFIEDTLRPISEVISLGQAHHEYYYVASP